MTKVSIIGYGKLGSHLNYALKKTDRFKVSIITKKSSSKAINSTDVIFITTQDSKIKNVVKLLSKKQFNLKGKYIFHTSGSLTSQELEALQDKDAYTGSFHPVQTFESVAKKEAGRFKSIYIAIEGEDKAVKKASQIISYLGAKKLILTTENKVYHHICCVIASNFVTTLISQIEKISGEMNITFGKTKKRGLKNGFNKHTFFNIYKPLASQTIENIAAKGAVRSLTGPFERNDLDTIIKHLKTLGGELLPIYILMGIETVKLSLEKKSIKPADASKILKTFDKSLEINKIH